MKITAKYLVFLPVRNGEPYILDAVGSVLAQDTSEFMLFILDNASTDGTLRAISKLSDPRIHIFGSTKGLSIEENWGRIRTILSDEGCAEQYVTFLGHDDLLYPNYLSTIETLSKRYPDASLLQTHFDLIDAKGRILRPCSPVPQTETAREYFLSRCWGQRDSFGTGYAFRASDYLKVGGIPPYPRLLYADDALWMKLAGLNYKASSRTVACAYRLHHASVSGSVSVGKFSDLLAALESFLNDIEHLFPEYIGQRYEDYSLGLLVERTLEATDFYMFNRLCSSTDQERRHRLAHCANRLMDGAGPIRAGRLFKIVRKVIRNCYGFKLLWEKLSTASSR